MAKVMVFRHVGSTLKSPASDRIVRGGVVYFVEADGVTETRSIYTHRQLHSHPFKFKELRDE